VSKPGAPVGPADAGAGLLAGLGGVGGRLGRHGSDWRDGNPMLGQGYPKFTRDKRIFIAQSVEAVGFAVVSSADFVLATAPHVFGSFGAK